MEYQEPLNVKIFDSNFEYFNLHTPLLMLLWWWWQKWSIHAGN